MKWLRSFLRDSSGAAAAEFAMVLPVALLFLLGTIDIGRYFWAINQVEKAVQSGTRYAVATRVIPGGLNTATFVNFSCPGKTLKAGDTICREALGTITCTGTGGAVSCNCVNDAVGGAASCPALGTANLSAFNSIVHRIQVIDPGVFPANVRVSYSGSGLGFAGDPKVDSSGNALSEISPVVTVEARGVRFRSMSLLGYGITLPNFRYSQTLEDGDGRIAY
ncbi:MAG: TadE/TadG family type IV pilus assembly protein [Novosphingobium sp.]